MKGKICIKQLIHTITYNQTTYLPRDFSGLPQYSLYINFAKNKWNTAIRKAMDTQKKAGKPPNWCPCRCKAMIWCSWAGAEKNNTIINTLHQFQHKNMIRNVRENKSETLNKIYHRKIYFHINKVKQN